MSSNQNATHVFIDNSNIWLGAAGCRADKEPMVPAQLFRIHFANLFELIEKQRKVLTKEIAGSLPPQSESLWSYAEKHGYQTNLLFRIDDGNRTREQSVDEALHLKIANVVLDYDAPQTLVLLTGDGRDSELGTSFFAQVSRAIKHGWDVELWSWRQSRNGKYDQLAQREPKLKIFNLDDYYESITFIVSGYGYEAGNKVPFSERVVKKLPK